MDICRFIKRQMSYTKLLYFSGVVMQFSRNLRFEMIESSTMSTLESCLRLASRAEQDLNVEQKNFETLMNGIPESLSACDDTEHPRETIDTYWDLYEAFPNIRRKTEVINAYSVLEYGLKSLCSAYEKALKGQDIIDKWYLADSIKYLKSNIGIDLKTDINWKLIKSVQELRNKLIHNNGVININNKSLAKHIQEHPSLDLDRNNQVLIFSGYAEYCFTIISDFFFELFRICPKYNNTP